VARLDAAKLPATSRRPRALVLAPTRELVGQIHEALKPLAKAAGLTTATVFGGVGQNPQVTGLRKGADIVLACPGRLEDLIGQGHCDLGAIEVTVLDEADHMADLGFLPAVRRLLDRTPRGSQRLLFSATLDKAIDVIVKRFLVEPVTHEADSVQAPVAQMTHHVLHLQREQRVPVLVELTSAPGRTVVFTRTKHGAKALARQLNKQGVPSVELHGNLSQNARTRNMDAFHAGKASTLVATDIAARGIHVDDVALVVHADPPVEHKAYLHRSGHRDHADDRRAGARRAHPRPPGRHQARDHQDPRPRPPDPGGARARRALAGPGRIRPSGGSPDGGAGCCPQGRRRPQPQPPWRRRPVPGPFRRRRVGPGREAEAVGPARRQPLPPAPVRWWRRRSPGRRRPQCVRLQLRAPLTAGVPAARVGTVAA
jgi:hypothetical protein